MSHLVAADAKVKKIHLPQLIEAAKKCGLVFHENQKTYRWFGEWMQDYNAQDAAFKHGIDPKDYGKCEHAFSVANNAEAYELGLVTDPNDESQYLLLYDFWGTKGQALQNCVGPGCTTLLDRYTPLVAREIARQQGHMVLAEEQLEDGWFMQEIEIPDEQVQLYGVL